MPMGNSSVPAWELYFTFRGAGDYRVKVPQEGYTAALGLQAVTALAQEIAATFDGV